MKKEELTSFVVITQCKKSEIFQHQYDERKLSFIYLKEYATLVVRLTGSTEIDHKNITEYKRKFQKLGFLLKIIFSPHNKTKELEVCIVTNSDVVLTVSTNSQLSVFDGGETR